MGRAGLLLIESPEARSELVCMRKDCLIIFNTMEEITNHRIAMHLGKTKGRCATIEERHEMEIRWFKQYTLSARPSRRWYVTQQELDNRRDKKCHCGKTKDQWDSKYRRLYCSDACSNDWFNKTIFWNQYREQILKDHAIKTGRVEGYHYIYIQTCDNCNKKKESSDYSQGWDIDHIIAIMNGGHPWDKRNLQVLCEDCHKIKTKQDHEFRREQELQNSILVEEIDVEIKLKNYKVRSAIPPGQLTL